MRKNEIYQWDETHRPKIRFYLWYFWNVWIPRQWYKLTGINLNSYDRMIKRENKMNKKHLKKSKPYLFHLKELRDKEIVHVPDRMNDGQIIIGDSTGRGF